MPLDQLVRASSFHMAISEHFSVRILALTDIVNCALLLDVMLVVIFLNELLEVSVAFLILRVLVWQD